MVVDFEKVKYYACFRHLSDTISEYYRVQNALKFNYN